MKKLLYFVFLFSLVNIYADVPLQQIEGELAQAQKDFDIARKMFNPWYGGPLLTGSGNVMPPGYININPSVQITENYAAFNKDKHSHSTDDLNTINPVLTLGFGLIKNVDLSIAIQSFSQSKNFHTYNDIGDNSIKLSFALIKEKPYVPALKISIKEICPCGKYRHLNPIKQGVDATGGGSYKTELGLAMSKIVWWWLVHPMQFRLALNYGLPSKASVRNFHAYGGGYNTDGKVTVGKYFTGSFGYELSLSQKVVLAIDLAYSYHNRFTFNGIAGTTQEGSMAVNFGPSTEDLSLAPAIEFVFTPDMALVVGAWFTVWGRNTPDYLAGIINFSYGF